MTEANLESYPEPEPSINTRKIDRRRRPIVKIDEAQRDLVERHLYLARRAATEHRSTAIGGLGYEDIEQEAYVGLVQAAGRYDPEEEIRFEEYASERVEGSVKDAKRKHNPLTRNEQARLNEWREVLNSLYSRLGRQPTQAEVAEAAGVDLETAGVIWEYGLRQHPAYLDEPLTIQSDEEATLTLHDTLADSPDPYRAIDQRLDLINLIKHTNLLNDNEKKTLLLNYFGDFTQVEIAQILGVTESRVSQINTKALGKLLTISALRDVNEPPDAA